jgi:hypothetical protein
MIIYSKNSNLNNAAYGRIQTPIKMVIENESNILSKKGGIRDWLFNVEKSNKFGETIITQNDFSAFMPVTEGNGAENDTVIQTGTKFIEHIQYMKEFAVTSEMLEDCNYGLAIDAKRRAENFTRAYYKTMNNLCELALTTATFDYIEYGNSTINLCTADGQPLFSKNHKWGHTSTQNGTQSNMYYGDICSSGTGSDRKMSAEALEEGLAKLSVKLRSMKDENGEPLGYTADTIILPSNRPKFEQLIKKVCGSEYSPGNNHNSININYGRWNIIILPHWIVSDDRLMLMSSEANKNLSGNMFFNRVPLTITDWVDNHTGNYYWNGRCRFGIGFGNYKHILLAADSDETMNEYTKI